MSTISTCFPTSSLLSACGLPSLWTSASSTAVLNLFRLADHFTNFVSVHGPPKRISPIFPISLHFSRLRTEKHSNLHLQSIVLTQFMKRYTKSHFTVSSETSLKGGGGQFLLNFFIFLS